MGWLKQCASVSLENIKAQTASKPLGTMVEPARARLDFLNKAASSVIDKLGELGHLPHQHALMIVQQCIQPDVRQAQRILKASDLSSCWDTLDGRLKEKSSV